MKSSTLLLIQCVMVALTVVAGSSDLAELMPEAGAKWLALGVAAVAAGLGAYTAKVGTMPADFKYPAGPSEYRSSPPRTF